MRRPTKATEMYSLPAIILWFGGRAYRRKVLVSPLDERLKQIIREVCEEHQAEIEELARDA
jgi:REP element-mobilizing transposase RayT